MMLRNECACRKFGTGVGVWAFVLVFSSFAGADTVTQVVSQAMGEHWMQATNGSGVAFWSDGRAPTNGNDYVCPTGMVLRTPQGAGAPAFLGDTLRIDTGATLALKMDYGTESAILGDLLLNGGVVASWADTTGTDYQGLSLSNHALRVAANSRVLTSGGTNRRIALRNARVEGNADMRLEGGNSSNDGLLLEASVDASAFSGTWLVGAGQLTVADALGLGDAARGVVVYTSTAQSGIDSPTLELRGVRASAEPLDLYSTADGLRTRLSAAAGTNVWGGPIAVHGDGSVQFSVDGNGTELQLAGGIEGTNAAIVMFRGVGGRGVLSSVVNVPGGSFFKTDSAQWVLATNGHAWARQQIAAGTAALGIDDAFRTDLPLVIGQGGNAATFDMAGYDQALAGVLIAAGAPLATPEVVNSGTSRVSRLVLDGSGASSLGRLVGRAGGGAGDIALTVAGGCELTLHGDSTCVSPAIVSNGMLWVRGSIASAVNVSGASACGGTFLSNLVVEAGTRHVVGIDAIGSDLVGGDYSLDGTLVMEVGGSRGTGADHLTVSNELRLGAASVLDLTEVSPVSALVYVLGEYGRRSGEFAVTNGVPGGYTIAYDYGPASNQIALIFPAYMWDGGAAGTSWADDANWTGDNSPLTTTKAAIVFDSVGSATNAGVETSRLDVDRTVGPLWLATDPGEYHSLEMTGSTLTVVGDLVVSDSGRGTSFAFGDRDPARAGGLVVTNGGLAIGYDGAYDTLVIDTSFSLYTTNGSLEIARRESNVLTNTYTAIDFSNAPSVDVTCESIRMASAAEALDDKTFERGILTLSRTGTNRITTTSVTVGDSPGGGNVSPQSAIHFGGGLNVLRADTVTMPQRKSVANTDIMAGGTLRLRGRTKEGMSLRVGFNDALGTGTAGAGTFDVSAGILDAMFDVLALGQHPSGGGSGTGMFRMGAGLAVASNVVLAVDGGTAPQNTKGEVNVRGGGLFVVTDSVTNGAGAGTIRIDDGGMIVSNALRVGTVVVGGNGNVSGTLDVGGVVDVGLGAGAHSFYVARNLNSSDSMCYGTADFSSCPGVTIDVGNFGVGQGTRQSYGTLWLSRVATNRIRTTTLTIGDCNPQGNTADWSRLFCGNTTLIDADAMYVGQRKSQGELVLTNGATVTIGSAANPARFLGVGYNNTDTGARASGIMSGADGSLTAFASRVVVGRHEGNNATGGSGTGTIVLDDAADSLWSTNIVLGQASSTAKALAYGTLDVSGGAVETDTLVLGDAPGSGKATGTVLLSGGSLRAAMIARGDTNGTSTFTFTWTGGTLDVGTFDESLTQSGGVLDPGGTNMRVAHVTGDYAVNAGAWSIQTDGTTGTNDAVIVGGTLTISPTATLTVAPTGVATAIVDHVIAEYGSLSGAFGTVEGAPANYSINYTYGPDHNQVALVYGAPGTMLFVR